jgi:hypothetical protein
MTENILIVFQLFQSLIVKSLLIKKIDFESSELIFIFVCIWYSFLFSLVDKKQSEIEKVYLWQLLFGW